ncbi:hypothetical protein LI90_4022 [Carbonactinospora thermoautotrophica]|uniref:PPE family domain-containing protein n=1 Tax=Carbonactinospora thermoautotrophica TaxID=1469144 RepID=A0A132MYS6_9ACTN|nr:WXG100 family type VII secretion target [Carbonactinospora thermoautotrophica]KWX02973.1 hypothetical protein LI90_4022 [Carbonactinospora thermoautotrophica]
MSDYQQMSHEQLYDMLMATDPGAVRATADLWRGQAEKLQDFAAKLMRDANGLRHSWQGEAAEGFFAAVERINQKVLKLAQDAATGSAAMTGAAEALETARSRMQALGKPSALEKLAAKYAQEAGLALTSISPVNAIAGTVVEKMVQAHLQAEHAEAVGIVAQLDAAYRDAARKLDVEKRDVYEPGEPSSSTHRTTPGSRTGVGRLGAAGYGDGSGDYAGQTAGYGRVGGAGSGYGAAGWRPGGSGDPGSGWGASGGGLDSGLAGFDPPGAGSGVLDRPGTGVGGGPLPGAGGSGSGVGGVVGGVPVGGFGGAGGLGGRAGGVDGRAGAGGVRPGNGGVVPGGGAVGRSGAAGAGRPGGGGAGGMGPMMGHGGAPGNEQERERGKRPAWLVEDEDVWAVKKPVVPPVIE